jgi:alpha-beta hydrolase superfamily lysophospholipase
MGGFILQKYLEKNQVSAAILLSTMPVFGVIKTTLSFALRHPLLFFKINLTFNLYPVICTPKLTRDTLFSKDISEDKLNKYFSKLIDESYLGFLDMLALDLPKPKNVNLKNMLVIGSKNDALVSEKDYKKTAKAYNASCKVFPDIAHDMMLEEKWQIVADYILKWLKDKKLQ